MRVAVIDSGVHSAHPHIGPVAGGISVDADGPIAGSLCTDLLGHGTAVMAAIQEKAPAAEYFAVRVFHTSLRTTAACLVRAIGWSIDQKMDVINLSLGSTNPAHAQSFAEAAARAANAGTLLVSARESEGQLCYPGCLSDVFGAGLDWDCPRGCYRCGKDGDDLIFYASGYPRPAPGVPPARNLHGISFAVANMTGFVVRACEAAGEAARGQDRLRRIRDLLIQGTYK